MFEVWVTQIRKHMAKSKVGYNPCQHLAGQNAKNKSSEANCSSSFTGKMIFVTRHPADLDSSYDVFIICKISHQDFHFFVILTGIYADPKRKNSVMEARMSETGQAKAPIS